MDEVGPEGQGRLLSSQIVVVGAGGLGASAIQYLAAVGVGEPVVVDGGMVERNSLQRQVVHCDNDAGTPKAESATAFVRGLNPDVSVEPVEVRVDRSSIHGVVTGLDVVVNVSDNFPTRYLLSDVYHFEGIPLVYGVIYKFKKQATTFVPDGPCYRCLFPETPEPGTVPDCTATDVLGVPLSMAGCIRAMEAMKLLLGEGETLDGRLLLYDAMDMMFETILYRTNPDCPACDEDGVDSIEDIDYIESCTISLD